MAHVSPFSRGLEVNSTDLDDYTRAKFAKAKPKPKPGRASGKKADSKQAKPRLTADGAAAPPPKAPKEPQSLAQLDDLDDAEKDLLGLAAPRKADLGGVAASLPDATQGATVANGTPCTSTAGPLIQEATPAEVAAAVASGTSAPPAEEEIELESPSRLVPDAGSPTVAARLAVTGSLHQTARTCPEGHSLLCYVIGWSCAFCDECDLMQRPGEVVFGCQQCESEMCAQCTVQTAPTPEAARRDRELIQKVTRKHAVADATPPPSTAARFVATDSGAILDTSPIEEKAMANDSIPSASKTDTRPSQEERARALPPGGQGVLRCGRGGCPMEWTRRARYSEFTCSLCSGSDKGWRWHCAKHEEDFCVQCRLPPPAAENTGGASIGGAGDIDDSASWKQRRSTPAPTATTADLLGEMLAEQERIIQDCGLDIREAREARESRKASWRGARGAAGGGWPEVPRGGQGEATPTPSASSTTLPAIASDGVPVDLPDAAQGDGNLMDENAARVRPKWAEEGSGPRPARDTPLERSFDLTLTLTGDFVDELARGYSQPWFQDLVRQCALECNYDRTKFLMQLQDLAFEVQEPILENWGFEGNEQGVYDMTSIIREHTQGASGNAPAWLRERVDRCLTLLYGGLAGGMLGGVQAGAAAGAALGAAVPAEAGGAAGNA